jgi:cell division protein ZapA (FtsZ GTPase activity inhibitor)
MIALLLQVINAMVPESAQNYVLQYGILGVITIVLAYVAFHQYQKLVERNHMLEEKIDRVQKEMNNLLIEERDRMSKLIQDNTQALNDLQKTILNFMISERK